MKIKEVIGIDVGKLTLDSHIHNTGIQKAFNNTMEGFGTMVSWVLENSQIGKQNLLFILEHTGLYSHQLIAYLIKHGYLLHVAPGLEVKRSLGIARGKDDKADAKRIALYGYRVREEVKPYQMPKASLMRLKRLMSMRKKLVSQRAGHIATLKEQSRVLNEKEASILLEVQRELIHTFNQQIKVMEKEIDRIIQQDTELENLFKLLTSIKGIGAVTARFLIVYTVGFTAFKTWRKFASYCGIAPFPNRSGTSIRGRTKVSHLANKEGKVLLNMCAGSAIQFNPQLRAYYQRRVEQGKNKMSTLNIIRNKLLAKAFAVVARGTLYVDTMKYAS